MEQKADTVLRQRTLFAAVLFAAFQVMLACLSSSSTDLLQVFTGLLTFLLPCGFHSRACLVMSDVGFRKVWPIDPIPFAPGDLFWNTPLPCSCLKFPVADFFLPVYL